MKFIIHTQYYPPELGAPQARLSEFARGLVKRGHQVTVLTAMPSYPQGKVYPGYGGLVSREDQQGVKVIRTFIHPTQKASLIPRLLNYFSFVISSLLIGGWLLPRADYLLTESPPLFLGISGYLLSRWKRARWIFNVSDLWPESAVRLGILKDGFSLKLSTVLEAWCYRKAWLVSGQSKSILSSIRSRFPSVNTCHFSNGVDTNLFAPSGNSTENGKVIALYAGLHGLAQGLDQLVEAAHALQSDPAFQVLMIGDGPEKARLAADAKSRGIHNIQFLDPIPKALIPARLAAADIALIPLKAYIPGAVPSKLYEAMASGKPVVLIAEGEAAEIVRTSGCGFVVKPGDITALVQAIRELACDPKLRQRMGQAGRQAALETYDRELIINRFVQFLQI